MIKRAEARKRAILWLKKELYKKQLKNTQHRLETISIANSPSLSISIPPRSILL